MSKRTAHRLHSHMKWVAVSGPLSQLLHVGLSLIPIITDKSRTKRPRNTKIGEKVLHPTGSNAHQFQGQGHQANIM